MTYEEAEKEIRRVTDPEEIAKEPALMAEAMGRSIAIGELAALRVAAAEFRLYGDLDAFQGVHRGMAEVMRGPAERLELVIEETIVALAKFTADMDNCKCTRCTNQRRREAAPYN